jgi:hypothetical protein
MTADERRQIEKALATMYRVRDHFDHEAAMNAALHMSDTVRPAPLAAAVAVAVLDLERLVEANAPEEHPDD